MNSRAFSRLRLAALSLMAVSLLSQDFRAVISGRITDSSDAAIPNVRVTATNIETGVTTPVVSTPFPPYLLAATPSPPRSPASSASSARA